MEGCSTDLSASDRGIFYSLLLKHADIFASLTADFGRTDKVCHSIDIGTAPPIRQPARRISPHRREEVKTLLEQMLEKGVVEPSSSPWASPVVLVRKKDGSMRFCIDYIESLTKSLEKTLTPYRASMLPWTLSTVHIGLRLSTCLVATGRSRWRRLTRRRPPSALRRASITSGLCPSGCVTPQPVSNASWTSCCQGCSGPNA